MAHPITRLQKELCTARGRAERARVLHHLAQEAAVPFDPVPALVQLAAGDARITGGTLATP